MAAYVLQRLIQSVLVLLAVSVVVLVALRERWWSAGRSAAVAT